MKKLLFIMLSATMMWAGCKSKPQHTETDNEQQEDTFKYQTEQFADLKIIRYQVPGFDSLTLKQKQFAYYLTQAAYFGRDIIWDQNYKYNLTIRRVLEQVVEYYEGDRTTDEWKKFMEYTKRVWFSNGIHHHYSMDKIIPGFRQDYLGEIMKASPKAKFPIPAGQNFSQFYLELTFRMFDSTEAAKRVNLDAAVDMVQTSACNFYEDVTQQEVEQFYDKHSDTADKTPISHGLNSKLIKKNGRVQERLYKVGGLYTEAIEKMVYWLEKAATVTETDLQRQTIEKLIEFYKTGDLKVWDEYNILWVKDTDPVIDFTNGFIEVYGDPLGLRGSWQSMVYIKDFDLTKKFGVLASEAAWFEKNSPIMDEYKRPNPQGVSYKVINVVAEAGDVSPSTPIGVNLPNANWIRATHGSKSVSLGNIEYAYDQAAKGGGMVDEFHTPEQAKLIKQYGELTGKLHTGLHEVIGHASGQMKPGIASAKDALKNYASTLEEARADLVALYFIYDQHLVDLGLIPSLEVGKAEYDNYIVNGMMRQLVRVEAGKQIEESHMRNRALVARWCYEQGKKDNVIEQKTINGKTFFVINDYDKLHTLIGQLLREVQRIKSEGDYAAGSKLVEDYGVKVDATLHTEVLQRFAKLNLAPYGGFMNPILIPTMQGDQITDVKVGYMDDFTEQMMYYAKNYSVLPSYTE